jgi:hypothetical protein
MSEWGGIWVWFQIDEGEERMLSTIHRRLWRFLVDPTTYIPLFFYLDFPDLIYPQCLSLFTRLPSLPLSSFIAHLQAEQSRRHQLVKVPVARDYLLVYFCLIFLV